jgi:hypothetical protein
MRLSPLQFNNEPGTEAYGSVDDVASKLNQVIERVNLHSQLFIQLRNSNSASGDRGAAPPTPSKAAVIAALTATWGTLRKPFDERAMSEAMIALRAAYAVDFPPGSLVAGYRGAALPLKMWTYKPMTIRVEHEAVSLCDKQGAHWPCDAVDFPSGSTQAPCPHHLDTMACEVCCPQDTWFK